MFPTILDVKNGSKTLKNLVKKLSQNSKKDRMTRFNISVTVKRRRDNYVSIHLQFLSSIQVFLPQGGMVMQFVSETDTSANRQRIKDQKNMIEF